MEWGKLFGVGIGPGDPELVTIKACRVLQEVPVLLVPKSRQDKRSLALSIIEKYLHQGQEQLELILPMTRDKEELQYHWKEAAGIILPRLQQGKDCAFITLGDPGAYSTFSYLKRSLLMLEPSIKTEVVPGVSSIHAAAAYVGEPLAEGDEEIVITTGPKFLEKHQKGLDSFDNWVILKAGREAARIVNVLEEGGFAGRGIFSSRVGFPDAFYSKDLHEIKDNPHDYLSTFIIKKAAGGKNHD